MLWQSWKNMYITLSRNFQNLQVVAKWEVKNIATSSMVIFIQKQLYALKFLVCKMFVRCFHFFLLVNPIKFIVFGPHFSFMLESFIYWFLWHFNGKFYIWQHWFQYWNLWSCFQVHHERPWTLMWSLETCCHIFWIRNLRQCCVSHFCTSQSRIWTIRYSVANYMLKFK